MIQIKRNHMKNLLASCLLFVAALSAGAATLSPIQLLSPSGSTSGQVIKSNGPSSAPSWGAPSITTVTGTLPIANGGTGATVAATALSNLGGAALAGATFTGAITPSQTIGIVGTTTNNNANAGSLGEFPNNSASGISLTTNTNTNITSVSLTAGDWDVSGVVEYVPAAGTVPVSLTSGISNTTASFNGIGTLVTLATTLSTGITQRQVTPLVRVSVASTTTIFLVAVSTFSGGTMTANGFIRARRVR